MLYVDPIKNKKDYDYILGYGSSTEGIYVKRREHLSELASLDKQMLVSVLDPISKAWTKWELYIKEPFKFDLNLCYDIHRSTLWNEIVAESDYPTYEENYDATRLLGEILEHKGFIPHYYYSGSKSIHLHCYMDFKCLLDLPPQIQDNIKERFRFRATFIKKFMGWLRYKIITCWDLRIREFDTDLVKSRHLIRSEMSRNKLGYKTFLGYTFKDISIIPRICNVSNRIYPKIGEIRLSKPHNILGLMEEFLHEVDTKRLKARLCRKEANLAKWLGGGKVDKQLKPCVRFLMSDEFCNLKDGKNRAMFILANELKVQFGPDQAIIMLTDWNQRMGSPIRSVDLQYRMRTKEYTLTHKFVHDFLSSLGFNPKEICKH